MGVTIKGLDKALKDLTSKEDDVIEAVRKVLKDTADAIQLDASNNSIQSIQIVRDQLDGESDITSEEGPRQFDINFTQRLNTVPIDNGLGYKTGIEVADRNFEIEVWTEFGTGLSAREILSRPNYTPEIREMARAFFRNGQGRLIGVPYLMPAFFKNTANLVTEIENEINKNTK